MPRRRLRENAAAQPAGARHHDRGEAAGDELGAARAQEMSPGHAGNLARSISGHFCKVLKDELFTIII